MANSSKFLIHNGVVSSPSDTPSLFTFLSSHSGAYTTTRTHNNGTLVLFWERHLRRLANSAKLLSNAKPELLFGTRDPIDPFFIPIMQSLQWDLVIKAIVCDNMRKVLPMASKERKGGDELSITTLVSGCWEKLRGVESLDEGNFCKVFDVYVYVGMYVPAVFGKGKNGAHLAVVGRGRDIAEAKYTDWVRLRKPLESLRPPSATELLLSNDGDQILEGSVTNFFVVCRKDQNDSNYFDHQFEIQTAPVRDGVLSGVIRQVIIDICSRNGIPLREVAPSWSQHELWEEAFITRSSRETSNILLLPRVMLMRGSLRILQHVETVKVPNSWETLELKSLENVTWEEKLFKEAPGRITAIIQQDIMKEVGFEGFAAKMI